MKERGLYEVLYRFNLGAFVGAHSVQLERVTDTDTGEVYAEKVLDPEAVTQEQAAALIGGEMATVLAQCAELQAQRQDAITRADAAAKALAQAIREAADLRRNSDGKTSEIGRLFEALDEAKLRIAALENENEALKALAEPPKDAEK
jgi:hypothetical protein